MIATIDENEIERLLETTEKLLEICKKNNSLSKYDLESIEDQTYYFRKAFEKGDFSYSCNMSCENDLDDDDY